MGGACESLEICKYVFMQTFIEVLYHRTCQSRIIMGFCSRSTDPSLAFLYLKQLPKENGSILYLHPAQGLPGPLSVPLALRCN